MMGYRQRSSDPLRFQSGRLLGRREVELGSGSDGDGGNRRSRFRRQRDGLRGQGVQRCNLRQDR